MVRKWRIVVPALLVVFAVVGIMIALYVAAGNNSRADNRAVDVPVVAEEKSEKAAVPVMQGKPANRIRNNEDIRRIYGRVETVYLLDGKSFTGAVIGSTRQEYTIVTVGGVKKVPMSQVKMRNIIR